MDDIDKEMQEFLDGFKDKNGVFDQNACNDHIVNTLYCNINHAAHLVENLKRAQKHKEDK